MQEFYIKKDSVNPVLRLEVINDGRYDFKKALLNDALQNCDAFFFMKDAETGILKISKQPAEIVLADEEGCEDKYILQYRWKERDTKQQGNYEAWFNIVFKNDLVNEDGTIYPQGPLIVPIQEDLIICIR